MRAGAAMLCVAILGCPAEFTSATSTQDAARGVVDCGVCADARTTCPITHVNGSFPPLGQNYWLADGCKPLGTPGDATTYDANMAQAAANAWSAPGMLMEGLCSAGRTYCKGNATDGYASWGYTGAIAGHVYWQVAGCGGPSKCCCPLISDNKWN